MGKACGKHRGGSVSFRVRPHAANDDNLHGSPYGLKNGYHVRDLSVHRPSKQATGVVTHGIHVQGNVIRGAQDHERYCGA